MPSNMFIGNIEAFPHEPKMYLELYPQDDSSDESFEFEMDRDEKTLASFLRKAGVYHSPDKPCKRFSSFARDILDKNLGLVYIPKNNITKIIDDITDTLTPENGFPGEPYSFSSSEEEYDDEDTVELIITERFKTSKPIFINEIMYPENIKITLTHKGKL